MSRSALVFLESLGVLDESIRQTDVGKTGEKEREKEEKTVLQANLYRAYGVIVPLVISDNNSDKEIRDNEKQDEDISTESGDALSR